MGCQLRIYISKSRNPFSLQSVMQSSKGVMRDDLKEKCVTCETGSSESSGNVTGLKFESRTPTLSRIRTPI